MYIALYILYLEKECMYSCMLNKTYDDWNL